MEDVYLELDADVYDDFTHGDNLIGEADRQQQHRHHYGIEETPHVGVQDYFDEACEHKSLHNFSNMKKGLKLGVVDIEKVHALQYLPPQSAFDLEDIFERIKLTATHSVPEEPETVALPNGDIYFFGGAYYDKQGQVEKQSNEIFKLDWKRKLLKRVGEMCVPRYKHGVALVGGRYVYIIGGINTLDRQLKSVERFDLLAQGTSTSAK